MSLQNVDATVPCWSFYLLRHINNVLVFFCDISNVMSKFLKVENKLKDFGEPLFYLHNI